MKRASEDNSAFAAPRLPAVVRACVFFLGLAICLAAGLSSRPAAAETPAPPKIAKVRLGFNGQYKVGFWTPIEITLQGGSDALKGSVEVTVPDGDGVPTRVAAPAVLTPEHDTTVLLYVKIGELFCDIKIEFRVAGKLAADTVTISTGQDTDIAKPLSTSQELILTLGSPSAIEVQQRETIEGDKKKTQIVRLMNVGLLPTRWYGYDGVDWLVLAGSEPEVYRQLAANNVRVAALDEWIRMGGKLLLYVGRDAPELLAPGAPLATFAPGRLQDTLPLRQTVALENYAEASDRVDEAAQQGALQAARLLDVRGKIEAYDGARPRDLPLVVRTPRGFGQIVFVAVDLDRPPLKNWTGRKKLFQMLLGRSGLPVAETTNQQMGQVNTLGYNDLIGQLRNGLEQFADVKLVPFWIVASLIFVYILFIGPFDYLLVKRGFKRMELTWLTFPVIVVLFSLGAYLLAYWLKGDELRMNRVEVVDFDGESGAVRGTLWSNIFSPQIDAYDLSLAPDPSRLDPAQKPSVLLSWMGLPGNSFGGMMNPRTRNASLFSRPYDFSPKLDAMQGMPISVWSTKGITARWYYPPPDDALPEAGSSRAGLGVDAELTATADKTLAGTLVSNLDVPLTGAVLLYDRWAYVLDRLKPGQSVKLDSNSPITIDTHFKESARNGFPAAVYDASSDKLERIVETMMFHEAVGGESYTKLTNDYQGFIDLSSHLKAGQAILYGHVDRAAVKLLRDGRPLDDPKGRRSTLYRFVFPVSQGEEQNNPQKAQTRP